MSHYSADLNIHDCMVPQHKCITVTYIQHKVHHSDEVPRTFYPHLNCFDVRVMLYTLGANDERMREREHITIFSG